MEGHKADVAWVQPFAHTWKGEPIKGFKWDAAVWDMIALANKATLPFPVTGSDIAGAFPIDFGRPSVVEDFIDLLNELPCGILFDYGTWDLSWELSLQNVPEDVWMKWGFGWAEVKEAFPNAWVQTNRPISSHRLFLEKVGWSLTPLDRAKLLTEAKRGCIIRWADISKANQHKVKMIAEFTGAYLAKWWDEEEDDG
jgi:hypothetical protein